LCVLAVVSGVSGQTQSCTSYTQCNYNGCGLSSPADWINYGCNCKNMINRGSYVDITSVSLIDSGTSSCSICFARNAQYVRVACPPCYSTCDPGKYVSNCACINCPAGSSCPGGTAGPTLCAGGTYSGLGQVACTSCGAGKYALAGSSVCSDCARNTYNTGTGQSTCPFCASGSWTTTPGATTCTTCPPA
jgi:hypothetical protein